MGITIILITHYMDEAVLADRVIVMDEGKAVLDDTPENVFSKRDEMVGMGLDVPQSTELISRLKKAGYNVNEKIITTGDCVEEIVRLFSENAVGE